jgi:Rad3-related DNA helicase
MDLKAEISRTPPEAAAAQRSYDCGIPIMFGFDCALCEQYSDAGYTYTAVNYLTGRSEVAAKRKNAFELRHEPDMARLLQNSRVAGFSRYQINRPVGQSLSMEKAKEILRHIFTVILPQYGYAVRQGQIELAEHILEALVRGETSLVEAGTGFGKSEAYLIPLIIVKLGRMNDRRNQSFYPGMQYADMSKLAAVVSTASIALQRAVVRQYIPKLSLILLENGVIDRPVTAILRKGREHYACRRNLKHHLTFVNDPVMRRELEQLLLPNANIDLAEIDGLSAFLKKKIGVPVRCPENCKYRQSCRFLELREQAGAFFYDVQVTNHQMLLADTLNRANGRTPLLPNYQLVIFDESHKLADAARSLYGTELSDQSAKDAVAAVAAYRFKREGTQKPAMKAAKKLKNVSAKLFSILLSVSNKDDSDDERLTVVADYEAVRQLINYRDVAERLITVLRDEMFGAKAGAVLEWAQGRYKASVAAIDLNKLLAEHAETREHQRSVQHRQAVRLHQALCRLPGIVKHIQNEESNRLDAPYGMNPERYVLRQEHSSVKDTIWRQIEHIMLSDRIRIQGGEPAASLIWDLEQVRESADALAKRDENICWLERGESETLLCATPKNLPDRLYAGQWSKGIPAILTSGTLSASGDFARIKQTLGLNKPGGRVTAISKESPYDYRENCLLYLSESVPFPDPHSENYIAAVTDEVERLIRASNGHAAVLFTSYYVMGVVHNKLKQRGLPYELFRLERGTSNAIERFRNCKAETGRQGVLFASGALWEGIDIPGDALSMLIIVKLPFPIPDAISEYERTRYPDFRAYRDAVILPDMLIKLKQGFGRLIRSETDTGVAAILDCRANSTGSYREQALNALPECGVTSGVAEVERFLKAKKSEDYFI